MHLHHVMYDIKFIQKLSLNNGPWNHNQPLIVECVVQLDIDKMGEMMKQTSKTGILDSE
jgi:hypothetical protein